MEKQPEIPQSSEQILAEKKEKITKAVSLMLDWQKSEKIEKTLLPQLDNLTSEEMDYCLKQIRFLDNQTQLRGPLSSTASKALIKDKAKLNEMEEIIGSERAKELKSLME